jgi:hypothetical protein
MGMCMPNPKNDEQKKLFRRISILLCCGFIIPLILLVIFLFVL